MTAQSTVRGLAPGYLFTLERCPRRDQNREYLLLIVDLFVRNNPYHTGTGRAAEWQFSFIAQPSTAAVPAGAPHAQAAHDGPADGDRRRPEGQGRGDRLRRVRPRARAVPLGPVHKYDEESSCWIRVSSGWAGNNWGQISIPRVGQEVIVDFINGDPDYPIIIGRVYNNEHKVPYALPRWKEYSTWKSRSTQVRRQQRLERDPLLRLQGQGAGVHPLPVADGRAGEVEQVRDRQGVELRLHRRDVCADGRRRQLPPRGGNPRLRVQRRLGRHRRQAPSSSACRRRGHISKGKLDLFGARRSPSKACTSIVLKCGANFIEISPAGVTIQGTMVKINSGGGAASVANPEYDGVVDCQHADTGEPGYLDKPLQGRRRTAQEKEVDARSRAAVHRHQAAERRLEAGQRDDDQADAADP